MCNEATRRMQKKNTLIISGLPKQAKGTVDDRKSIDTAAIHEITNILEAADLQPEVTRIGEIDWKKTTHPEIQTQKYYASFVIF